MQPNETPQNVFPPGWDAARVRRVLDHYEAQSEEEAVTEDEAAFDNSHKEHREHKEFSEIIQQA